MCLHFPRIYLLAAHIVCISPQESPTMSSYFSSLSFARAKKNQEDLQKTNPTEPVLNDEDEKFLTRVTSQDAQAHEAAKDVPATRITDDGEEKEVPKEDLKADGVGADQVAVPATQPEETAQDPPEEAPKQEQSPTSPTEKSKKSKKDRGFDLPSQEEAEAATRGFNSQAAVQAQDDSKQPQQGEKRTWASYLPSMPAKTNKDGKQPEGETAAAGTEGKDTRTWTQYASSYIPSAPSLPASWTRSKDKDAKAEPVYKEDGTIDEEATKKKQEQEVSVLLDNLSLSSINNRVFSFSEESQKYYDRFTQVLKDTLNGAPTAYEDMDKLMKDAGPTLERNFASMPPFVQTLVKSLPAKLGSTLGPEILAASSEKPGNDMQKRMAAAEKAKASGGDPSIQAKEEESKDGQQKKKRKIPGLKSLMSGEGMVASMLRNVVNFLQVRFPFLASTTNVVLSLAVFSKCSSSHVTDRKMADWNH